MELETGAGALMGSTALLSSIGTSIRTCSRFGGMRRLQTGHQEVSIYGKKNCCFGPRCFRVTPKGTQVVGAGSSSLNALFFETAGRARMRVMIFMECFCSTMTGD